MSTQPTSFWELLSRRVAEIDSLLCIGLDPHRPDVRSMLHPAADAPSHADAHDLTAAAEEAFQFCVRIIDQTIPYAACFKPNAAFFEALGAPGEAALGRVIAYIRTHTHNLTHTRAPVLLDVKRGDISTTAEAYSEAAFDVLGADAVTLSPYMGSDSIEPFTRARTHTHAAAHPDGATAGDTATDSTRALPGLIHRGVFLLCKTSNPGSNELQTVSLSNGRRLFEHVAVLAHTVWGTRSHAHTGSDGNTSASADARGEAVDIGLVVGATDPSALTRTRTHAPSAWILCPGVGAQGGDLRQCVRAGLRKDGSGLLVPVSRAVARAKDVSAAARDLRDAINAVRREPVDAGGDLSEHARTFLESALSAGVLRFGEFTLKSGRKSPYFFNAGNFCTGAALGALGRTYAAAIAENGLDFDVLFGPAYKGIPLVTATAIALSMLTGKDVPVAYNRKEAKDHGEGGTMVGASVAGKRVLIVDDVITAGTAITEATAIIQTAGGTVSGVVIGLDRQEVGGGTDVEAAPGMLSAVQQVEAATGVRVIAVAQLHHLVSFIQHRLSEGGAIASLEGMTAADLLERMRTYRARYGVKA